MATFYVETTDMFGGERNYSWVRRYKINAKSVHGAICKLRQIVCYNWRIDWRAGGEAHYVSLNGVVGLLIREWEDFDEECRYQEP